MIWTDADKAIIKSRIEAGERPSAIAPDFKVTRNTIIGLMNRNGWISPHKQGQRSGERKPRVRENGASVQIRICGPNWVRNVIVNEEPMVLSTAEFDAAIPIEQRKTLQELKDDSCRWIVGDPRASDYFFCGAVQDGGYYPYCAFHHRVAIQPPASGKEFAHRQKY